MVKTRSQRTKQLWQKKESCRKQSSVSKHRMKESNKLEEMLPGAQHEQSAEGQADMEVEEEQDRKVVAAKKR